MNTRGLDGRFVSEKKKPQPLNIGAVGLLFVFCFGLVIMSSVVIAWIRHQKQLPVQTEPVLPSRSPIPPFIYMPYHDDPSIWVLAVQDEQTEKADETVQLKQLQDRLAATKKELEHAQWLDRQRDATEDLQD